jgi:hypothetical protein
MAPQQLANDLEVIGQPAVVRIEERHDLGARTPKRLVARHRHASVWLAIHAYPPIEPFERLRGPIGGAVVDDDELEV